MSIPSCLQLPKLRLYKLPTGQFSTLQKIGRQHYLVWIEGVPITEVQCVPPSSRRWYWRGSHLNFTETRARAITGGVSYASKGGSEAWTDVAGKAIEKEGIKI